MPNQNGSNSSNSGSKSLRDEGGRIPPQAVEVEEAVLGAMLIEREAATIALQLLRPEDFYKPANKHIFETLFDLYERDNPLDLLTVENELRDKNLLDVVGGTGYLADLTRSVSSAANIDYHSQIIAEKSIKRNLILHCNEIIKTAYDTTSDASDVLDEAEQRIFDLSNNKTRANATVIGDILKDTLGYLEDLRGKPEGVTGVPSGLDVDKYTSGWQNGDLIIIAARPSMGKTAFTLTAARNAALHANQDLQTKVAIFSLEMSSQQLVQRFLTMEARINAQDARTGRVKDEDFKRLIDAASRLFTAGIFIDDTPSLSLMELRTKCRRLKSEHDVGLIVVDYLQLMTANSRDIGNREQEIATISRGLKSLAKELSVPVIALAQLSRAVEQRGGDKRPQLSDLRESGCLRGDTIIPLADTGERVPIRDLVSRKNILVWALDQTSKKIVKASVQNAFSTGVKPCYKLTTQLGRIIHATGNHKFLTIDGWKRLDQLAKNNHIALPHNDPANINHAIPDEKLALALSESTYSGIRNEIVNVVIPDSFLEADVRIEGDIYWDKISEIRAEGTAEVYDLTVPEHHNFIANDIIVHNSIEQDADVVCFLYRPEYYGITTTAEGESTNGLAELIIGKQRNGPVGTTRMYFVKEYARFERLSRIDRSDTPGGDDYLTEPESESSSLPPPTHNPGGDDDKAPF